MLLEKIPYVPTLAIRPSEMNGLQQLPGVAKNHMQPLFLVAPWTSANSLEKAIERVEKAYSDRNYFVDLDPDYSITNPEADAQRELIELFSPSNCYSNWWKFVAEFSNAVPCLQLRDQSRENISTQVRRWQEENREFCLRIVLSRFPPNLAEVVEVLSSIGTADYTIILEGGWVTDALQFGAQMSGLIASALGDVGAEVPIVVSCTTMPKEFHQFQGCTSVPFTNRALVQQISRDHNRRRIIYGDWGSTRPREPASFRQRPTDRIDYPTLTSWVIGRNSEELWGFKEAANAIVSDSGYWDENLETWGTSMILQTLVNPAFGINTPQKNVASRVNIHLYRQALYDLDVSALDFDDDWSD